MNVLLLKDPVVLICAGIIFIGLVALFWAVGKFRRMGPSVSRSNSLEDMIASTPPLPNIDFKPQEFSSRASASTATPPVTKEVSDRLESMSQRLSEMQTVLMKQSAAATAPGAAAAGGVGQGFSPETIDKLLKIIGNVIQQVDILQKNIEPPK